MPSGMNSTNDISQIRQLIFGENISEYERKFSEFEKRLQEIADKITSQEIQTKKSFEEMQKNETDLQQKLEQTIEMSATDLKKNISSLKAELEEKIEQLSLDKTDRMQIGNYLIEMGMNLKGQELIQQLVADKESGQNGK